MNLFPRKKWFTLVEVIIVCVIFATIMVGIILAINRAYVFLNNTRMSVRATNLAREWVEMVYNFRDTNRRKYSWEKDKHWICLSSTCYEKLWSIPSANQSTFFTIKEKLSSGGNYVSISWVDPITDNDKFYSVDWFFSDTYSNIRKDFKIDFTWTYSYYSGGTIATWNVKDLLEWPWIEFYRVLRVYGVYCKNSNNSNDTSCSYDSDPKELRFCVKVFYTYNWWKHATELCSIMTNFME